MRQRKPSQPTTGREFALARLSLGCTPYHMAGLLGTTSQTLLRWEASTHPVEPERMQRWRNALRIAAADRANAAEAQGLRWADVLSTGHDLLTTTLLERVAA